MKLYLLRHGEAEMRSKTGKDIDKQLSENGQKQADIIKTRLGLLGKEEPFTVYCSSAKRAVETYSIINKGFTVEKLQFEDSLYLASRDHLIEYFKAIKPATKNVLLVGHNEGISEFASYLLDKDVLFPTAGLLEISFPIIEDWKHLGRGTGGEVSRFFNAY